MTTLLLSINALAQAEFNAAYEAAQAGDYKQAVSLWTVLAEQGDPVAQYTLGWMYESGQGVVQNVQQAVYWYEKSAAQKNVSAQYVLASMYDQGDGLIENQEMRYAGI